MINYRRDGLRTRVRRRLTSKVRISGSHPLGRGSTPRVGISLSLPATRPTDRRTAASCPATIDTPRIHLIPYRSGTAQRLVASHFPGNQVRGGGLPCPGFRAATLNWPSFRFPEHRHFSPSGEGGVLPKPLASCQAWAPNAGRDEHLLIAQGESWVLTDSAMDARRRRSDELAEF